MIEYRTILLGILLFGARIINGVDLKCTSYCTLEQSCWPISEDFKNFTDTLDGKTLAMDSPEYRTTVRMKNTFETKSPYMVVLAESVQDIQKSVNFARQKNIRVAVFSSGHDYIGRSTGDGVLMISLEKMKKVSINLTASARSPHGEITAESGNTWWRVYREVDNVGRVIVGGSAQTVSMGGYNLGGGHSPMSRKLGLAVDNLLEVQMVTADGRLVTVNADGTHYTDDSGQVTTEKDDLFWALRGGGGGTFGVVVSFTMKLHLAPDGFVEYNRFYAMYLKPTETEVANDFIKKFQEVMINAPEEWGGYIIMEAKPTPDHPTMQGLMTVHLVHFGGWSSASRAYIESFDKWNYVPNTSFWTNRTSFLDYKKNNTDPTYFMTTLQNTLVQERNLNDFADMLSKKYNGISIYGLFGCTNVLLGGQTKVTENPDVTSVNPALRTAFYSTSCGLVWDNPLFDRYILDDSRKFNKELQKYGTGVYLNEPAESETDWIKLFWGDNTRYQRLKEMKKKYDPATFFIVKYGVGYDDCADSLSSKATLVTPLYKVYTAIIVFGVYFFATKLTE